MHTLHPGIRIQVTPKWTKRVKLSLTGNRCAWPAIGPGMRYFPAPSTTVSASPVSGSSV